MATVVAYEGAPAFVGALAQMLQEEGVAVEYDPPIEERGAGVAQEVIVNLFCDGAFLAIQAGVQRFRKSRFGMSAKVTLPDEDGDE